LDEPSGNLDDRGVEALKVAVAAGGDAATVLATHDLHRLSDLATRVVVMRAGEMAYDSGPATSADGIARAISMYRETNR
jgi:energy-coupling factor transporter ATP-binding protein EcfA2